jgi:acyl dehydratase
VTASEVASIYDKKKAAVITVRTDISTEAGELICENEAVLVYIEGGGFGGEPGPKSEPVAPPEGVEPDFRISYAVPENQAALYRLTGDLNPLHIDAESAKHAGFDRPILHGLCTFGYATRAILCGACDGDVERFKEFKARFSAPVLPGDTLTTEGWKEKDGRYAIRASTDRGVVMSNAYAVVTP